MGRKRREVIRLPGLPVAKKNRRRIYGGKNLPSVDYLSWESMACAEIAQFYTGPKFEKMKNMKFEFNISDNVRRDIDNCVTSCLDMLQKADVISGDHWQVLPKYSVEAFSCQTDSTVIIIEG